jgi:anaerobic dimethyl sulfoxide reductase subunit C (anchor subunit)
MSDTGHRKWSLVFFTTLTQLSVGTFVLWGILAVIRFSPSPFSTGTAPIAILGTVLTALILGALVASSHLGRPIGAIFSLSNWRRSWLSREALLAAGFGLLVLVLLILRIIGVDPGLLDYLFILSGSIFGFSLIFGIARLYRLRTVPAWNHYGTTATFFATSILTGVAVFMMVWFLLSAKNDSYAAEPLWSQLVMLSNILLFLLVGIQAAVFSATMLYLNNQGGAGAESVRLLWQGLRSVLIWRWLLASAGLLFLILPLLPILFALPYILLLISELLGRYLFYAFYQRTGF